MSYLAEICTVGNETQAENCDRIHNEGLSHYLSLSVMRLQNSSLCGGGGMTRRSDGGISICGGSEVRREKGFRVCESVRVSR
ncbi:hypothetical protein A2U01_0002776 [Trifolium medium]|uniref:Uncharacterized protein n=1 Tax=Trifolium medium TaxID=97028 RepID=A0A392M3U8_9FABA|nr:hypothetical protein [Trifolium medium]